MRQLLTKTGLPGLLSIDTLARFSGQNFILPFYHIISNENRPHIKHLYRVKTEGEFEADLDLLLKHYSPIAATDLPAVLDGRFNGQKIFLLTFDDGLREVHDVIAPILLRKGVPAIFFLNSAFIDNKALMFRYKVSLLLELLGNEKSELKNQLKAQRNDTKLIAETAQQLNLSFETFLKEQAPYMTTEQGKALLAKGFTIGAHSVDHPYYEDLSTEEQLRQTFDSLTFLQQQFGIKEKLFAFPFTDHGVKQQFFAAIFSEGKIDFSFGGAGFKHDVSPKQLQRLAMETSPDAETALRAEYAYYLLKALLGKNRLSRN